LSLKSLFWYLYWYLTTVYKYWQIADFKMQGDKYTLNLFKHHRQPWNYKFINLSLPIFIKNQGNEKK